VKELCGNTDEPSESVNAVAAAQHNGVISAGVVFGGWAASLSFGTDATVSLEGQGALLRPEAEFTLG